VRALIYERTLRRHAYGARSAVVTVIAFSCCCLMLRTPLMPPYFAEDIAAIVEMPATLIRHAAD